MTPQAQSRVPLLVARLNRPVRSFFPASRCLYSTGLGSTSSPSSSPPSSSPTPEQALQAKWAAKWAQRPGRLFNYDDIARQLVMRAEGVSPLVPVYGGHAEKTMLSYMNFLRLQKKKQVDNFVYHDSIRLSSGSFKITNDLDPTLRSTHASHMGDYIARFGRDVVMMYFTFRDPETRATSAYRCKNIRNDQIEEDLLALQQFLSTVWKAVILAHASYRLTQAVDTPHPGAEEPGVEYIESQRKALLSAGAHFPMETEVIFGPNPMTRPKTMLVSDLSTEECKIYLAAKEAEDAMMSALANNRTALFAEERLRNLAHTIITHAGSSEIQPRFHYYAAQTLLNLLAPVAPAFAEEAWIVLLEGPNATDYSPPASETEEESSGTRAPDESPSAEEWKAPETADSVSCHGLPIRGRPETIWSIFDMRLPPRWPPADMDMLRWRAESVHNTCDNFRPNNSRPNNFRPNNFRPNNFRPNNFRPNNFRPNNFRSNNFRPNNFRPNDSKPNDSRPNDSRPNDSRPNDSRPNDSRPNDSRLNDLGPSSYRPSIFRLKNFRPRSSAEE